MSTGQNFSSASRIAEQVNGGQLSAKSVLDLCLAKVTQYNKKVNAFTAVFEQRAQKQAKRIDKAIAAGKQLPLAGVPFAVKNLFDVHDEITIAGSKINRSNQPAHEDAILITRLESRGAILVGALNMGEYAYDFTGENAHYGVCRNPWNIEHMSGGSSSGSGAALAAGMVPITLGSDTNGSIRVPSSLCGTFGLKPTYGRLPRSGSYPFCDSLDHLGPMAHNVEDLTLAYNSMQGFDSGDHACVNRAKEIVSLTTSRRQSKLRVALAADYFDASPFPDAKQAIDQVLVALRALDYPTSSITLPLAEAGRSAAFIITNVESAAFHRARLIAQADHFDPATRDRFLAGCLLPAAWYTRAQAVRQAYARAAQGVFEQVDVIIAPATPYRAPRIGQQSMNLAGREVGVRANLGYFTQPISCIGLPVVCAPIKLDANENLPIGVQIIAAPWREADCLQIAHELQTTGIAGSDIAPDFDR